MNNLKNNIWASLFVIYTRYLIGAAFVFASVIKIKGLRFISFDGTSAPIHSLNHYFETMYQSGIYWQFIGWGQLVAGALLMTQRYAKLGALLYFPIITNIFVITISYDFANTPVVTGLMLLANTLLIFWDWNELKILINLPYVPQNASSIENFKIWELTGLALFAFTLGYRLINDTYNFIFWFSICFLIGTIGLFMGFKKIKLNKII